MNSLALSLRILLIEDNLDEATLVELHLRSVPWTDFSVTHVTDLAAAQQVLSAEAFDACLLDLNLPDSQGMGSIRSLKHCAPNLPIVVLTGDESRHTEDEVIRNGGQDYLIKAESTPRSIARAIRYSIQRARLQNDLQEQSHRLRDFALASADCFWELDAELCFRWFAEGLHAVIGTTPDELLGKPFSVLTVHPEQDSTWQTVLAALAEHGIVKNAELHVVQKNGQSKWIRVNAVPLFVDEQFVGYRGTGSDLTPLKQVEDALEQSIRRQEWMIAASGIGLWDWDLSQDILQWDQQCYRLLGYTTDTFSMSYAIWHNQWIHPEDRQRAHQEIQEQITQQQSFIIEVRLRNAVGGWTWVEQRGRTIVTDAHSNPQCMVGTLLNIDDRKQTYERIDKLLQASVAVIYTLRPGHLSVMNYVSQNLVNVTGYKAHTANQKLGWLATHLHPDDYAQRETALQNWLAEGAKGVLNLRFRLMAPHGQWRWIEDQLTAIRDPSGVVTELVGAMLDATGKVETSRRLEEREGLLQSTLNSLDDLLLVLDREGHLLDSHAPQRLTSFGFSPELHTGEHFTQALPTILIAPLHNAIQHLQQNLSSCEFQYHLEIDAQQRWFSAKVSARLCNAGHTYDGAVCLIRDDTERVEAERRVRESEELFHSIFEHASYGIATIDLDDGHFTTANPSFMEMLDLSPETVLTTTLDDLLPPDSIELRIANLKSEQKEFYKYKEKISLISRNNTIILAEALIRRVTIANKYYLLAIFRDITQRMHAQEKLEEYRRQLETLNTELEQRVAQEIAKNQEQERLMMNQSRFVQMGEMLSMIAHQWRQPLNAISIAAINLVIAEELGDANSEKSIETGRFIQEQAGKMSETITDFMEFFRPEKAKENFLIQDVISEAQSLIGAQLEAHGIEFLIHWEIPEGSAPTLCGQRNELAHVFLNLIGNARDALQECAQPSKLIQLTIHQDTNNWIIDFKDNAGGIPEHYLDRIFDPYFTTKPNGKGTGIGLYMTRIIIERNYHGKVTVRNDHEGAVFSIKLPY